MLQRPEMIPVHVVLDDLALARLADHDRYRPRGHRFHGGDPEVLEALRMATLALSESCRVPVDAGATVEIQELLAGRVDVELDGQTRGLGPDPLEIRRMGFLTAADEVELPPGEPLRDQRAKRADHLELLLRMAAVLVEEAPHREDQRFLRSGIGGEGHRRIDHVTLTPPPAPDPSPRELRDRHDLLVR